MDRKVERLFSRPWSRPLRQSADHLLPAGLAVRQHLYGDTAFVHRLEANVADRWNAGAVSRHVPTLFESANSGRSLDAEAGDRLLPALQFGEMEFLKVVAEQHARLEPERCELRAKGRLFDRAADLVSQTLGGLCR